MHTMYTCDKYALNIVTQYFNCAYDNSVSYFLTNQIWIINFQNELVAFPWNRYNMHADAYNDIELHA
jgi:hypothetical protein